MELVGIEAVSRGAKKAILCDNSKNAIDIIKKNVEKTHTLNETEIYQTSFENLLKTKLNEIPKITFIDPPYDTNFAYEAVKIMQEKGLINEESIIVIETDQEKRVIEQLNNLDIKIDNKRKYGRANLIFLSKKRKG